MKTNKLRKFIREAIEENAKACPAPTQNVGLNTANRDRAIQADFRPIVSHGSPVRNRAGQLYAHISCHVVH